MLLRLAYLIAANTFSVLRLLPMTDREKDAEILVLRHQITVLERQLDGTRVRFTAPDRVPLGNSVSSRDLVFRCGIGVLAGTISRCCCH